MSNKRKTPIINISLLLKYVYSFVQSKTGFKKFGRGSIIKFPYRIWNKKNIEIGKNVFIVENSFFAVSTTFKKQKFSPRVVIGNNVSIGSNFFLGCIDGITIEDNVIISDRVFIADHTHSYENPNVPIIDQPLEPEGKALIKSGSFIGVNAVIMPGVTIGKNSVVGASSVVTRSVPDYAIVAGAPAKVIKRYDFKTGKWKVVK
jgi:acetyltransferase-like isoleucine patch superfamily enzyme